VHEDIAPIAIADDGELQDVRLLLDRLELPFVDSWSSEVAGSPLRISNPRHALDAGGRTADGAGPAHAFHIVILDEESLSLASGLQPDDYDFIVRRPVHPAALRLLILHALYSGPERRTKARVAMGADVKLRAGLLPRAAVLCQLSERGCGLVTDEGLAVGDRTQVVFPRSLMDGPSLTLEGRVVSCVALEGDGASAHNEVSIAFRPPNAKVREQLRGVMAARGVGRAALLPRRIADAACATGDSLDERRSSPRRSYCRPVLASAKGGVHTIIGRDLSTGGMRVARDPRLAKGDLFKLVIYQAAGKTPIVVKAVVARDDGPKGWVLHFRDVSDSVAATLAELVDSLPRFGESVRGGNVVLSEVIDEG
jgi:hypothetical protein